MKLTEGNFQKKRRERERLTEERIFKAKGC